MSNDKNIIYWPLLIGFGGLWFISAISVGVSNYPIIARVATHITSAGYLVGFFYWVRSRKSSYNNVSFNDTSNTDLIGCFGRIVRMGISMNVVGFAAFIIFSNFLVYFMENHNWNKIEMRVSEKLQLNESLGDPINFVSQETSHNDSITHRIYTVIGELDSAVLEVTVNDMDSILEVRFLKE